MSLTGPFQDQRSVFVVAVSGHRAAIPAGPWMWSPVGRAAFEQPGAAELRSYLDAVLYRRRESNRLLVVCRDDDSGTDHTVRAYCTLRGVACTPIVPQRDTFGPAEACHRRDIEMLARAHALVWFGPREDPGEQGPDLVTLAALLGIPYRVVPLVDPTA